MTLPKIPVPKIDIPFDISLLMHPPIVHFLIAIPVLVFLLEILNLMMKKKAVGGVSFLLLILTVVAAVGAYFTGLTDGKEAYPALDAAAKAALGEHKLLGVYIVLGSVLVLGLKILAMTGVKLFKALYILIFIVFLVLLFKQGEEGGELVYEHGLNVQQVKKLDDTLFDTKEELEELQEEFDDMKEELEEAKTKKVEVAKVVVGKPVVVETVTKAVEAVATPVVQAVEEVVSQSVESTTSAITESAENIVAQ